MEHKWRIYLITNDVNDRKYVGQTTKTVIERWYQHMNAAAARSDNTLFHQAVRILGASHFKPILLEEVNSKEKANEREQYWIAFYDSFDNGYNSTPGGATLPNINNDKPVMCVAPDHKRVVARYKSVKLAGDSCNLSPSSISYACRNFSTAGGYYWCYPYDYMKLRNLEAVVCNGKRYIVKVDINTFEVLAEYLGVDEASAETGMSSTFISRLCNNDALLPDEDFVMRWKSDWLLEREQVKSNPLLYKPLYVMQIHPRSLRVMRVYKNSKEASKVFGLGRNTLDKHVDRVGSLWRDCFWCTCRNYNNYTTTLRRNTT